MQRWSSRPWPGEEQGLLGAREQARAAKAAALPVQAVFNNDIVGGSVGGDGIVDGADHSSLLGGAGGFAVAIARGVHAAHGGAIRARRIASA